MLKIQVIGNLTKDGEVNTVGGKSVINFTVAHSEKYKDNQGNNQEKTTFIDCAYWVSSTGIAPYLKKGTKVFTEGTPSVKGFAKKDGTAGASLNVRVREIQLLGGNTKSNETANTETPVVAISKAAADTDIADDLPF